MANRNYNNGRRREYEAVAYLKSWGYNAMRAAGSHGAWDVIGWNASRFVLAQVKYNCKPTAEEMAEMKAQVVPSSTIKMVMLYRRRKSMEIINIE